MDAAHRAVGHCSCTRCRVACRYNHRGADHDAQPHHHTLADDDTDYFRNHHADHHHDHRDLYHPGRDVSFDRRLMLCGTLVALVLPDGNASQLSRRRFKNWRT